MKDRILREPAFALGMVVWLVAATAFPWQLGLARASIVHFALYIAIAGGLLAVADVLLNPAFYRRWDDVALQGVFWAIGLSVPGGILFALGHSASPAADRLEDRLCIMAGLANPADHTEGPIEEALEPTESCEIGS